MVREHALMRLRVGGTPQHAPARPPPHHPPPAPHAPQRATRCAPPTPPPTPSTPRWWGASQGPRAAPSSSLAPPRSTAPLTCSARWVGGGGVMHARLCLQRMGRREGCSHAPAAPPPPPGGYAAPWAAGRHTHAVCNHLLQPPAGAGARWEAPWVQSAWGGEAGGAHSPVERVHPAHSTPMCPPTHPPACPARLPTGGQGATRCDNSGLARGGELHALLTREVMLRRLKRDVLEQLPPKRRQVPLGSACVCVCVWGGGFMHTHPIRTAIARPLWSLHAPMDNPTLPLHHPACARSLGAGGAPAQAPCQAQARRQGSWRRRGGGVRRGWRGQQL